MRKSKTITKRQVANTLRESVFAPSDPGPLRVILELGTPEYLIRRTVEILLNCQDSKADRYNEIGYAIGLLALAKIQIRNDVRDAQ